MEVDDIKGYPTRLRVRVEVDSNPFISGAEVAEKLKDIFGDIIRRYSVGLEQ